MANFSYLTSIYAYLDSKPDTPDKEGDKSEIKKSCRRYSVKAIIALVLGILCAFILIKVYEVPVYYTKIDVVTENSDINKKLDISIKRNYDRSDKYSSFPDTLKYFKSQINNIAGIIVDGSFKSSPHIGLNLINNTKLDSLKNVCIEERTKYTQTLIENPQFVYFSILTSDRQMIGHDNWPDPITHYYKDKIVTDTYFNGEQEFVEKFHYNDFFNLIKVSEQKGSNGCLSESYYYASQEDSPFLFIDQLYTPAFKKPPVWRTLEDVSKLVEIIELGTRSCDPKDFEIMWGITNSLKIDYVGPAEFSEHITPKPDSITQNYILYTDWRKIQEIGRRGLRYHVSFPDMENIQEARIFILSGLVTGLFALFFKYSYRSLNEGRKLLKIKRKWIVLFVTLLVIAVFLFLWFILKQEVNPYSLINEAMKK